MSLFFLEQMYNVRFVMRKCLVKSLGLINLFWEKVSAGLNIHFAFLQIREYFKQIVI